MIDLLNSLDSQIYLFFNGMHTPLLDTFMSLFTGRFIWIPLYVTLAAMLVRTFGVKLGGVYLLGIGMAILLTDQTCATVLRPIFERLRPSHPDNPLSEFATLVNGYRGGTYGFPSCHSANSFALATFICCLIRRPRIRAFILVWALLNSYTRLYLGVHYPGDLLAGGLIGAFFGYVCYRVTTHYNPRKRDESLAGMGRPVVTLPELRLTSDITYRPAITIGDLTISVGVVTMLGIAAASVI